MISIGLFTIGNTFIFLALCLTTYAAKQSLKGLRNQNEKLSKEHGELSNRHSTLSEAYQALRILCANEKLGLLETTNKLDSENTKELQESIANAQKELKVLQQNLEEKEQLACELEILKESITEVLRALEQLQEKQALGQEKAKQETELALAAFPQTQMELFQLQQQLRECKIKKQDLLKQVESKTQHLHDLLVIERANQTREADQKQLALELETLKESITEILWTLEQLQEKQTNLSKQNEDNSP